MIHRMRAVLVFQFFYFFLICFLLFQLLIFLPFFLRKYIHVHGFLWLCMTHTNEIIKFCNFPSFPWSVWTVQFAVYHTLSGWVCNSFFSLSKFPCPASLIIIDPMSVELLMRRWSNNQLSDWSARKTKHGNQKLNSVSLKVNKKSLLQR